MEKPKIDEHDMIDQIEAFEIHNNTNSMSDQYYAKVAEGYTTAMTPQTDDPDIPALTFRSIFLGTIWAIFLASSNILFSFRTNWFQVPTGLAQLLSYPMGIFLAAVLPKGILNPGPFSIKEHVLIFIIAGSAGGQPYGVDNVITQHANFLMGDPEVNLWNSFAWVAGSQLVGYGVAGICRRFLVKPVSMLWPTVLPNVALFTTLNNVETLADKRSPGLSRSVFFWATFAAIFIWTWLPNYFVSVFGTISVLCFITTNRTARFLGSATSGIGLGAISLDWGNISSYSPIAIPWFATVNYLVGTITWQWIVVPICYYSNIWGRLAPAPSSAEYSDGTPFGILNVPYIYSSNGTRMRVSRPNITSPAANDYTRLLDQEFKLDMAKYEAFKPFVLTEFFAISYFCSFMNIAAIFSHVALWHGSDLVGQTKSAFKQISTDGGLEDVHNRLMRAYRDIPEWMYATWLVAFTLIQIAVCQWTPFHMPWWASIMAIAMGVFSSIPIGIVQAITGTQIGLNVITEFVIGLILPGDARAVITFKSLGYNIVIQALNLVSDLKIGHYMHISPIAMVVCQLLGTLIGILFNTGGAFYILDIMTSPQVFHDPLWNGVGHQTFLNAAGIWGSIGPARFFGSETPYFSLLLGFPIGFVLPFLPWLANRFYPSQYWQLINVPLLTSFGNNVGAIQAVIIPVAIIGFTTQFYMKRNHTKWFDKYNFLLSIALDSGMAISVLVLTVYQSLAEDASTLSVSTLRPASVPDFYCQEYTFDQS